MTVRTLLALGLSAGTLSLAVAGCSEEPDRKAVKVADTNCATKPAPTTPKTPTVAVLTQLGQASEPVAGARQEALKLVVAGSTEMKAHLMLNAVGEGIGVPNLVVNTTIVAEGENDLFRDSNLQCKFDAIDREYAAFGTKAIPKKLDVFAALRTLKRDLEGVPHGVVHVVLLASMLNTEAIDLTKNATLRDPARSINTLAANQQNFRCPRWRVYAVGGSITNGGAVSAAKDIALRRWWSAYFKHCGGVLVSYNTKLAKFPLDARAVEGADHRKLVVERKANIVVATLNSKVLFNVSSAELRAGAGQQLTQLLPLIANAKGRVEVDGHTDNSGNDAVNKPLSKDRARAVARWLTARGRLSSGRLEITGYGSSVPVASNRTAGGRARNRRVVVTIHRR